MSHGGGGGGINLHPDLAWLLFMILVLFLAWTFAGGKDRAKNTSKPFLYPASPVDSGDEYGPVKKGEVKPTVHAW